MKQRGKAGERERDGEESPSERPLMWKTNLRFNLPSNETHMTHPELVHSHASISLCLCVYLFVSACVAHAHMVFVMFHTCAR